MIDGSHVRVHEVEHAHQTRGSGPVPVTLWYTDHQPGDATRYELATFDMGGKGMHLGQLGYVSKDAMLIVAGNSGRAYLFQKGDTVSEDYVAEKFALTNPHTIHHVTHLVAEALGGSVVGCFHEVSPV